MSASSRALTLTDELLKRKHSMYVVFAWLPRKEWFSLDTVCDLSLVHSRWPLNDQVTTFPTLQSSLWNLPWPPGLHILQLSAIRSMFTWRLRSTTSPMLAGSSVHPRGVSKHPQGFGGPCTAILLNQEALWAPGRPHRGSDTSALQQLHLSPVLSVLVWGSFS